MEQNFLKYIIFTYKDCPFLRCWSSITRGGSRRLELKGILHPQSPRQNLLPVPSSLDSQAGCPPTPPPPPGHLPRFLPEHFISLSGIMCQHSLPSIYFCCALESYLDPWAFAPYFAHSWHSIKGRE